MKMRPVDIKLSSYIEFNDENDKEFVKANFKNATVVDTSEFAKKTDLAESKYDLDNLDIAELKNILTDFRRLKREVDKLDIGKLETTLVDLS